MKLIYFWFFKILTLRCKFFFQIDQSRGVLYFIVYYDILKIWKLYIIFYTLIDGLDNRSKYFKSIV